MILQQRHDSALCQYTLENTPHALVPLAALRRKNSSCGDLRKSRIGFYFSARRSGSDFFKS
jgi:hypothetical protein